MEAWVLHIPESVDRIKVWSDIIIQLRLFFNRALLFSAHVTKAMCTDPFFYKCQWTTEEIDTLLNLIEMHIKAASAIRNWCKKALILISCK